MNELIFEPIAFFAILACVFAVESALLLSCDAIYVVPTPYSAQSKGIARELEIAEKNGIEILEV